MSRGKVALITGSTTGIGERIAEALAAKGCCIALHGLAERQAVDEQCGRLRSKFDVNVRYYGIDLSDTAAVAEMVSSVARDFGALDILVNNAVTRFDMPIEDYTIEQWNYSLAVNLTAPFQTIRTALPYMRKMGWGRIINMSSVLGLHGAADRADYVTVKTALVGLTRAVAMETLDDGITCNALSPGLVHTARSESRIMRAMAEKGLERDDAINVILDNHAGMGHFVDTVPDVVSFLCSDGARDITGSVITVDHGISVGADTPLERRERRARRKLRQ